MTTNPFEPPKEEEKRDRWGLIPRLNPDGEPKGWIARRSQTTERQKRILQLLADQPATRRRWYQTKLSTILVLVAIAAWAMSYWPWLPTPAINPVLPISKNVAMLLKSLDSRSTVERKMSAVYLGTNRELGANRDKVLTKLRSLSQSDPDPSVKAAATEAIAKQTKGFFSPALDGPLLALAAFLAWKLGWEIVARRKRRREVVAPLP